jgi:hypothetical protein
MQSQTGWIALTRVGSLWSHALNRYVEKYSADMRGSAKKNDFNNLIPPVLVLSPTRSPWAYRFYSQTHTVDFLPQ